MNYVKLLKESFVAVLNTYKWVMDIQVNRFTTFKPFTDWNGIPVIKSTHLMRLRLGDYHSPMNNACASAGENIIVIPDHWDELPEEFKLFMLYHEEGHIRGKHFLTTPTENAGKARSKFIKCGLVMPEELEADKFAFDNLGLDISVSALQVCKTLVANDARGRIHSEIDMRIEKLRSY
jgi:hypothetical protein